MQKMLSVCVHRSSQRNHSVTGSLPLLHLHPPLGGQSLQLSLPLPHRRPGDLHLRDPGFELGQVFDMTAAGEVGQKLELREMERFTWKSGAQRDTF